MNLERSMLSALRCLDGKRHLPREIIIRQALVAGVDLGAKWQEQAPENFFVPVTQGKADPVDGSKMKGEVR